MQYYTLNDGNKIPVIGFGTWKTGGEEAIKSIRLALDAGYRHIDTAAMYRNEAAIGEAIKATQLPREDLFITSKLHPHDRGYAAAFTAFEKTRKQLGLDYLDLYLIHWPANKHDGDWQSINLETWKALEELQAAGKIKSIGVSNFLPNQLNALLENTTVVPAVNQIEFHPGYMQPKTIAYCKEKNILVEAWSPLGRGAVLPHATMQTIADKYRITPAQLCIKWCLQHGTVPLPKSVTPARMLQNIRVFDFVIEEEDMKTIDELPQLGYSGYHPEEMTF